MALGRVLDNALARVLVVEDDEKLLDASVKILNQSSFHVVAAVEGAEAIRKHRNQQFDLVITDLRLPKLSGKALLDAYRETGPNANCPIIVTSGYVDDLLKSSFRSNGTIHFLPKPYGSAQLVNTAKDLLQAKKPKKPAFDVNVINTFLFSTIQTISTMAGVALVGKPPTVRKNGEVSGDISGVVTIAQPGFHGSIALCFMEPTYLKLLHKILGSDCKEINDQNKGSAGELMNMIFCQAKKAFNDRGKALTSVLPSVVVEKAHTINHNSLDPVIVIQLESEEIGACRLEICART